MINKFFAFLMLGALTFGSFGTAAFADTKKKSVTKQTNALASLLPASDAVAVFDGKKFFETALPQILSNNQPLLNKVLDHLNEVKSKIGIDARQFEQIAVGVGIRKVAAKEYDFAPVALMRGAQINAGALIALAKTAANGKYREEKIGDKSVFVFDLRYSTRNAPAANNGQSNKLESGLSKMPKELAVTAIDSNTLAIGTTARVRETLSSKIRISPEISGLLDRNPSALMSFGGKVPGGLTDFLPMENDELGKNINAIKYLSGSADVAENNAIIEVAAKTTKPDEAQSLLEQLQGLQMIGKAFLGSSKSAKTQVYARMIDNADFSRSANEVLLNLRVPQTDINVLIGEKK